MKRLLLIATAFVVVSVCYSQSDFRKGYVITQAGDTLRGLVSFREGAKAFHSCVYRKSWDQEPVTYGPLDVAGYGFVNDKVFESRDIALRDQPPTTAFLEVIVRGLVTLYRIEDVFLVQKEGGELQQLINKKFKDVVKGREVLRNSNEHIMVLSPLLFDCVETREQVQKAKLTQRILTKLIERYNECMDAPAVTPKEIKPWFEARPGIVAGVALSDLDFDYRREFEHLSGDFETAKAPMFGLTGEFLSPRISERFSFLVSALYSAPKYHSYTEILYLGATTMHWVDIELSHIKVPMGFRYTFPTRTITPYINVGLSTTFHLDSKSHWIERWEYNGDIIVDREDEALNIKANQTGWWAGVGIQKVIGEKFVLFGELRYERTDGIAESFLEYDPKFESTITNIQVVLGISLR